MAKKKNILTQDILISEMNDCTEAERVLFADLCAAQSYTVAGLSEEEGIGIYNEKRLHKMLKRTLCEDESCFEVKVGRFVADVLDGAVIREIQCRSFTPLVKKIEYYLSETDYAVQIVHPIIVDRLLIRAERETGEILSQKLSPKHETLYDALAELYPIRHLLSNRRLSYRVMLIECEEYRYSERRYRCREGRYDHESFPTALVGSVTFRSAQDYAPLLPDSLRGREISAADFAAYSGLKGRKLYSALNVLSALGILRREERGRCVVYVG